MRDHDTYDELVAGFALDALEPEDEHIFLAHLGTGCALCARSLRELGGVAADLAYAAEPAEPPARLKDSILAAVRADARPVLSTPAVPGQRNRPQVVPLTRRARGPVRWLAAAASLVALLLMATWNVNLRSELDVKSDALAKRQALEELAAAPGTQVVRFTPAGGAAGSALIHDRTLMVVLEGLPENGNDYYALWAQDKAGALHWVAKMQIVESDRANLIGELRLPLRSTEVVALAITRESGPEPHAPSSKPILSGPIA
jgi:hypothetical protein